MNTFFCLLLAVGVYDAGPPDTLHYAQYGGVSMIFRSQGDDTWVDDVHSSFLFPDGGAWGAFLIDPTDPTRYLPGFAGDDFGDSSADPFQQLALLIPGFTESSSPPGSESSTIPDSGVDVPGFLNSLCSLLGPAVAACVAAFFGFLIIRRGMAWAGMIGGDSPSVQPSAGGEKTSTAATSGRRIYGGSSEERRAVREDRDFDREGFAR